MSPSHSHVHTSSKKIALVGSHGTGKTTLTKRLAARVDPPIANLRIATTPEVPRIVCSAVGNAEYFRRGNNSLLKQLLLLIGQPIYEISEGRDCDILICDRSILDHWAYTKALFASDIPADIEKVLCSLIRKHLDSYDLLAYVPIEFAVHDDGTREGDVAFQAAIDTEIHAFLGAWGVPFVELRGSVEQRSASLVQHILSLP